MVPVCPIPSPACSHHGTPTQQKTRASADTGSGLIPRSIGLTPQSGGADLTGACSSNLQHPTNSVLRRRGRPHRSCRVTGEVSSRLDGQAPRPPSCEDPCSLSPAGGDTGVRTGETIPEKQLYFCTRQHFLKTTFLRMLVF